MGLHDILCIYVMAVSLVLFGTPTVGVDVSLTLLPALGSLSSYWVSLSSLDMRVFVLCFCVLFCPVLLLTLGDLLISEKEIEGKWM